jgi:hypothetical protein
MADAIQYLIDNFKCFSKQIQDEILMTHFNRAARKRYYKTGILKQY